MWLLPSRGRPTECQQALDAFAKYGSAPGVLYVHETHAEYVDIRLPDGWIKHEGHDAQAAQMQWLFNTYPDEKWYGWIADDNRPKTPEFDRHLIDEAGDWHFVYCNGGRHKTPAEAPAKPPATIPSAMMWGGELVRHVGWWAPPWIKHATIDEHWKYMMMRSGLARYRHDVVIEHLHWRSGLRPQDSTDKAWLSMAEDDIEQFTSRIPELNAIADELAFKMKFG